MIKEDHIEDVSKSILDALKGLTYLEAVAVLEVIKHGLIADKYPK